MKPFLDSTGFGDNGPQLRKRMDCDGYLFIRNLIPANVLEELRLQLLEIAAEAGWIRASTPLKDAIANLDGFCVEPEPEYMDVYHRMYKILAFHTLQHHPNLVGLLQHMLDEPVLPHPRIIGRTIFPKREQYTTPAHQDFVPIQGTEDTYSAWIPLSDVPKDMGGLQVAVGSHRHGVYDFRPALGAGGLEVTKLLDDWVGHPLQQGDVLFFHSMTVHKGLPNVSQRLRMSIDARYQKVSDPISADSLEPHGKLITWDQVYAQWPTDELQYYWRKWNLSFKPYDNTYHEKRDQLAMQIGAAGDPRARSALQRIVARDPDPQKRQKAQDLLAALDLTDES